MDWLNKLAIVLLKIFKKVEESADQLNKMAEGLAESSKKSTDKSLKEIRSNVEERKRNLELHKTEDLKLQILRNSEKLKKRFQRELSENSIEQDSFESDGQETLQNTAKACDRVLGSMHVSFVNNKHNEEEQEKATQFSVTYKKLYRNIPVFLHSKGITKLYHFTDIRNLSSIIQCKGLYSWYGLKRRNIPTHHSSNNVSRELDFKKQLHNYVRLAFTNYHPMTTIMTREQQRQVIWLEIDLDVTCWNETLYADRNATDREVEVSGEFEFLKHMNYSVFEKKYSKLNPEEKKRYQAEVLVENFLPLQYISNLDELKWRYL